MSKRYYVQRQHIIASVGIELVSIQWRKYSLFDMLKLDLLLYQLHAVSFFLSPSLFLSFCRLVAQFICLKPRELGPGRALRFFYLLFMLLNLPSICTHLFRGGVDGRAIILDFIGNCMFMPFSRKNRVVQNFNFLSPQPIKLKIPLVLSGLVHHILPASPGHHFIRNIDIPHNRRCWFDRHTSTSFVRACAQTSFTGKRLFDFFFITIGAP